MTCWVQSVSRKQSTQVSYLLGDVGRRRHVEDGLKSGLVRGPLVVQAVLHRHGDGSDLIAELSVVLTNARFCSYFKGLMLDVHVQLQRRHFCSYFEGTQTILISLSGSFPHPQEDLLLLAGWSFPVGHRHVLGELQGPTVQEENALSGVLLLETVQQEVHAKICRTPEGHEAAAGLVNGDTMSLWRMSGLLRFNLLRVAGAPRPLAFRQYFTVKLDTQTVNTSLQHVNNNGQRKTNMLLCFYDTRI